MKIQFNAFDKNSSANYGRTVKVSSKEELEKEWNSFEQEVNTIFFKWYFDNVVEQSSPKEEIWLEELSLV